MASFRLIHYCAAAQSRKYSDYLTAEKAAKARLRHPANHKHPVQIMRDNLLVAEVRTDAFDRVCVDLTIIGADMATELGI